GTRQAYEPWLKRAAEAGLNIVRVPGTMVYEAHAFHELCDELGILVWQDFMFANMDYPAGDEAFRREVVAEADGFMRREQISPSLTVLCGGSEVAQQAAMLGFALSARPLPISEDLLAGRAALLLPGIPYVANSPTGGALPFSVGAGVAHYFGVGAYLRPLDDARRACVPFASECLAFANIPEPITLGAMSKGHAGWDAPSPRDQGASWDFADVRDHYLETLYGIDARRLRSEDPAFYTEASRAAVADVFETTFSEWRSGTVTAGALTLALQDLAPGAGWGIIDATGEPKSPWYALKRVAAPTALLVTDEGLDGLMFHVLNDGTTERSLRLELRCLLAGSTPVLEAEADIHVAARGRASRSSAEITGRFFDINGVYRFGPPSHDVSIARLYDRETRELVGEAVHLMSLRLKERQALGLAAQLERDGSGNWLLHVTTARFARRVHIDDRGFAPSDNYFHMDAARPARVRLLRRPNARADATPSGVVSALNASDL
ncbi:MAG: glycoside hydrolase family 2 protein, partial [Proteobacteria bacterium]|nr:glycoside hydrolase family 2 protein [Pseudomonadota bacterium]